MLNVVLICTDPCSVALMVFHYWQYLYLLHVGSNFSSLHSLLVHVSIYLLRVRSILTKQLSEL